MDATTEEGNIVSVVDERRRIYYTESQVDYQIISMQVEIDKLQKIKDAIILLKG